MSVKAFNEIEKKLNENLSKKGFHLDKIDNLSSVFSNNRTKYKIEYSNSSKKFTLSSCPVTENVDGDYKSISVWLFDPENDTEKEVKSIAEDFLESVNSSKNIARSKKSSKKSDETANVDLIFLINRLATVFPEIKDEIKTEKESFESFRGVTFIREKILPYILELVNAGKPKDTFKKLCSTLSNLYESGNLDVRSVITIVILNSVSDETASKRLRESLSENLVKAWDVAKKFRNRKVRPERRKKRKTFFEKTLENTKY